MTQSVRRNILIAAIGAMVLGVLIMSLRSVSADTDARPNVVRETVDPTVLPPVKNPTDEKSDASNEAPLEPETLVAETEETPKSKAETPVELPEAKPEAAPEVAPAKAPEAAKKQNPEPNQPQVEAPKVAKKTGKGVVTGVDAMVSGKVLIMTIACDRPVGDTSYMNLDNPRRLVIDLHQPWTLKTANVVRLGDGPVKHVVAGNHPDKLRLVIHFNQPPQVKLTPEFTHNGNKLIVSVPLF